MTYFLTGANGLLGRRIREIFPSTKRLILGMRDISKNESDLEARSFDYDDQSSMKRALEGVDTLLFISSNAADEKRITQHENVILAAKQVGVKRIIYLSFITLYTKNSHFSFSNSHAFTEECIKKSGLLYTFIRPSWYMENIIPYLEEAKQKGYFTDACVQGKISFISKTDVAKAMVYASIQKDAKPIYIITGKAAFSLNDVAAMLTKITKKEISYKCVSIEKMKQNYLNFGLPMFLADSLAQNCKGIDSGEYALTSDDFALLCEDERISLEDFIKDYFKV